MEQVPSTERKTVQISKKKFITLIVVILVLIAGWYFLSPRRVIYETFDVQMGGSLDAPSLGVPSMEPVMNESDGGMEVPAMYRDDMMYYPYPDSTQTTIEDTREFLKINYSAEIKTRDVTSVVTDVQMAVATVDGRIDRLNSSEKYGSLSFVVPKSSFYEFREQIRGITHEKLIIETVSSENLLSEKQDIEQRQETLAETLARLTSEKSALETQHTQRLAAINANLASLETQLASVRQKIAKEKDADDLKLLRAQETGLVTVIASLTQDKSQENTSYAQKSDRLARQITSAENGVKLVEEQDEQFDNNIETVSGTVSVRRVSLWDMARTVSPIHPTIIIILLALILWRYLYIKGTVPRIQFV